MAANSRYTCKNNTTNFPKPLPQTAQPQLNLISTIITHWKQKMKKWVPAFLAHCHDNLHYCMCDQMSFPLWNKQSKSKSKKEAIQILHCFTSTQAVVKSLSNYVLSPIPQKPDHTKHFGLNTCYTLASSSYTWITLTNALIFSTFKLNYLIPYLPYAYHTCLIPYFREKYVYISIKI